MSEIITLKKSLENSINAKSCFAIFDELFSSTNTEDSESILPLTLDGLTKYKSSFFIVSSHPQCLKNYQNSTMLKLYFEVKIIQGERVYTYKLREGWSDLKLGFHLFKKMGLKNLLE